MKIKVEIDTEDGIFDGKDLIPYIKGYDYKRVIEETFTELRKTWKHSDDRKLGNYAESLRDFIVEEMRDRGLEIE
jgi:hypothetical protein